MQRQDIIKVLSILRIAYPKFYANMSKEDANETITMWLTKFQNVQPQVLELAVNNLIDTSAYPPSIADVKNEVFKITAGDQKTEIDLWNELRGAISNGIYHSEEIFPKLSKELQAYLKTPMQLKELAMSNLDEIDTVQKGIFLKQMPVIMQKQKEETLGISDARKLVGNLANRFSLGE